MTFLTNPFLATGGGGAPQYPVIESVTVTVAGNSTTTLLINMPATRPDGDLYVMFVGKDDDPSFTFTPQGWTEIQSGNGPSANLVRGKMYYKIGASEPASYSTTIDSETYIAVIFRISNFNSSNPINVSAISNLAENTSVVAPAVTTTVDDCLILYCTVGNDMLDAYPDQDYYFSAPFNVQFNEQTFDYGTAGAVAAAGSSKNLASAGSSGSALFGFTDNLTGEEHVAITVAIEPA